MFIFNNLDDFSWRDSFLNNEIIISERYSPDSGFVMGVESYTYNRASIIEKTEIRNVYKNPKLYDWRTICIKNILPEKFLRDFSNYLDWWNVCIYQTLSQKFIYDFEDKLPWYPLCLYQNLSEELIEDFIDKVDLAIIARKQRISKAFIIKYLDRLDLGFCLQNKNIDEETKTYIRMFI